MAANTLHALRKIMVQRGTIEKTLQTMRKFGSHGWEALILWLGEIGPEEGKARVIEAFVPNQKPIKGEDGVGYFVDSKTLFQLNKNLSETGLRLIAQVHSHPTEAFHSAADDRYAIVTTDGGLSLVVPNFGHAVAHPTAWANYRLFGSDWKELDIAEVRLLFEVVDDQ